jgi:Asp-tRNA(Asn)/Glu-tRNA(Gln) amidotransferase A subunit family amidase
MPSTDLNSLSALDLARLIRTRKVSPLEAVDASLARIAAINPTLNAFCFVYAEEARAKARAAERQVMAGAALGPLHGVPIAIKDLTKTKGKRTTLGSKIWESWIPDEDAVLVERLLGAGAILVGKTTTPEFAYSSFTESPLWGVTRNPWNPARTSGGSSGGSGVAVATGCVPLAEGSDAGGSVRLPAAWCGTVGLKPSLGRIPFDILETHFCDIFHFGPLARTVEDAALFLNVTQGPDDRDSASLPALPPVELPLASDLSGLRLGLSRDLGVYAVDDGVAANLEASAAALRSQGAIVEPVAVPWTNAMIDALYDYWRAFFADALGRYLAEFRAAMDPLVVRLIEEGRAVSGERVFEIGRIRTQAWQAVAPLLRRYDALLCPTTTVPAPEIGGDEVAYLVVDERGNHSLDMTCLFNLISRSPALQVPSGMADGLPTGLQIVGRRYDDATVLRVGRALEAARPWPLWQESEAARPLLRR